MDMKRPTLIFHVESIFVVSERFEYVKTVYNHPILSNIKYAFITTTTYLAYNSSTLKYLSKIPDMKCPTLIFDVESIFSGFRTIKLSKNY